jgi:pilus assembly protein Flp/PilA
MKRMQDLMLRGYVALKSREEEGQGLAEYGLILALIAVVCITALTTMGTSINTKLGAINAAL